MKVSFNWLKEYFNESELNNDLDLVNSVAEKLTATSFEVEEVLGKDNDFILDIDVLPNRAHDCLCHRGVAGEIATATGLEFFDKTFETNNSNEISKFSLKIDSQHCHRYIGCHIENVKIGPSPDELKNKLQLIGEKSINNIVDITNIVMFEIGQPMHAFDADKLEGEEIVVRQATDNEKIITLDNKDIQLNSEMMVIADSENVLAIAGIKGGKKAEVDLNTKNIILEAANFNSVAVRKNSRNLGIITESSKRFENFITPALAQKGIDMAIELIKKYASDENTKIYKNIEYYPKPVAPFYSGISVSEISKLLGQITDENNQTRDINFEDVEKTLKKLRFEYRVVLPAEKIITEALKLIGKKYKWGASVRYNAPELFDCSSLVCYLFAISGVLIPRTSVDQFAYGIEISKDEILPGDLFFSINPDADEYGWHFETKEFLPGTKIERGVDHVGIYLGDNKIIHATNWNNSGVIVEDLNISERFKDIVGYRRYFDHNEKRFVIKIPDERIDLINVAGKFEMKHIDLIEEIGRVIGLDSIKDAPIVIENYESQKNVEYYLNNEIRLILSELGFSEVITYSFVESGEIMPEKPLAEDKKYLRADLKTGIEKSLEHNIKYADLLNLDKIKIFEIGKVFKADYTEQLHLAIAVKNKAGIKKPKPSEILLGAVEQLQEKLKVDFNIKIDEQTEIIEIILDDLYKNIKPNSVNKNKLSEPAEIKFKSISVYPFISRDIAVWIPNDQNANQLLEIIKINSGELLANEPRLFDVFEKEGKTSYAYRMAFQSPDQTLTDEKINEIMGQIYNEIKRYNDWEIR
jgi:phenylalanyl-tRNA synthetase beta subunit